MAQKVFGEFINRNPMTVEGMEELSHTLGEFHQLCLEIYMGQLRDKHKMVERFYF